MSKRNKKYTTEMFIDKLKFVYGNRYDYSLVKYTGSHGKIKLICPEHGIFEKEPNRLLNASGCKFCYYDLITSNTDDFIKKSNLVHHNKYDYTMTVYNGSSKKIKIICSDHGVFEQTPQNHLTGFGCLNCMKNKKMNTVEFINKSIGVHGDKYDYSHTKYVNSHKKIKIICSEHGTYEQTPTNHLSGNGCPFCRESRGEKIISKYLNKHKIGHTREKTFEKCKNIMLLSFDFYLPEHNLLIEYDGIQHYEPSNYFGGLSSYHKRQVNDQIKNNFANENNIKLFRIKYDQIKNINKILDNKLKIN